MRNNIAIGIQSFEKLRENQLFYIDKTSFIKERYEADLIAKGIPVENIKKYRFAFEGKKVLIGEG